MQRNVVSCQSLRLVVELNWHGIIVENEGIHKKVCLPWCVFPPGQQMQQCQISRRQGLCHPQREDELIPANTYITICSLSNSYEYKENLTNWADLGPNLSLGVRDLLNFSKRMYYNVCHEFHPLIIQLNTTELKLLLVREQKISNWVGYHNLDEK